MVKEKKLMAMNGNIVAVLHVLLFAVALFFFAIPGLEFFALLLSIAGAGALKGYFSNTKGNALVLLLFGKYKGCISESGFFWANPLYQKEKVSTRLRSFSGKPLQLHDLQSTPIIAALQASWQVKSAGNVFFEIDNIDEYFRFHADKALRKIASGFRMDLSSANSQEITLLRKRTFIENTLLKELQKEVDQVGISVLEVRISALSYAPEVAATFWNLKQVPLQLANKNALAEGALKIAERTLYRIAEKNLAVIDEERRASFIQSLVVAICSGKEDTSSITSSFKKEL